MTLNEKQKDILAKTEPVETPAEFQALRDSAKARMDEVVKETQEPNQAVSTTLTELRDLLITAHDYAADLAKVNHGADKMEAYRQAIVLLATGQKWFGDGWREGLFRVRPVAEIVSASKPWRNRISLIGGQAFVFDDALADQFADVNSTGTIDEEIDDLAKLNDLVEQHKTKLMACGLTDKLIQEGKALYTEATNREITGVIGLRNANEATLLRNRLLTFATLLGKEVRAAGLNACHDNPTGTTRFSAASFRNAIRAMRPKKGRGKASEEAPAQDEAAPKDNAAPKADEKKPS